MTARKQAADFSGPQGSYTVFEFAKMHRFSVSYVYKVIHLGLLQAFRPGGNGPTRVMHNDGEKFMRHTPVTGALKRGPKPGKKQANRARQTRRAAV